MVPYQKFLPEKIQNQCRNAADLRAALEAAQEAGGITPIAESGHYSVAGLRAVERASWSAAEAAWGAKRATQQAAREAAWAAEAAAQDKANPDDVLRAACQLWIQAASWT